MTTPQILAGALLEPARAMPAAVARRTALVPVLVATCAALALALTVVAKGDLAPPAGAQGAGDGAEQLSPHDLEEKAEQGRKLATAALVGGALVGPGLSAALAGVALALGFRLAGARPPVRASFSAASWALLPGALAAALTVPLVIRHAPVRPDEVPHLLAAGLGVLVRPGAPPQLARAAWAVNLFSLWGVALAGLGMAEAAGTSRRRALAVTFALWVAYVAVFVVALPSLAGGPPR